MNLTFWDKQINRANELAGLPATNELLVFYASVLSAQRDIYQFLANPKSEAAGDYTADLQLMTQSLPILLKAVEDKGSTQLQTETQSFAATPDDILNRLIDYSNNRSPTDFLGKGLFQPYGRWCLENGRKPFGAQPPANGRHCPACGGLPQVSVRVESDSGDGGSRNLLCASCLCEWPYRRVACANCGEEAPTKLAYFKAEQFTHIKIEICESCKRYVKNIDLTELGNASPLVDDIATASLDLWAVQRGYTKVEINLVGL